MNAVGARFITITAYQLPGAEGIRLEYHWDLEGRLLGFPFTCSGRNPPKAPKSTASTTSAKPPTGSSAKFTRSIAIDFTGREYEPLLLREGDSPA